MSDAVLDFVSFRIARRDVPLVPLPPVATRRGAGGAAGEAVVDRIIEIVHGTLVAPPASPRSKSQFFVPAPARPATVRPPAPGGTIDAPTCCRATRPPAAGARARVEMLWVGQSDRPERLRYVRIYFYRVSPAACRVYRCLDRFSLHRPGTAPGAHTRSAPSSSVLTNAAQVGACARLKTGRV